MFVGGFRIGRMPGYFTQNAKELRALGVPRRSIHFLYPDSHKTVEENRETVRDEILRIAGDRPERLVIIAHSRGACDALTFALHEPEFVRDRVEALFLIQGAFGGTGLADYVLGEGKPMDEQMSRGHRFLARGIGAIRAVPAETRQARRIDRTDARSLAGLLESMPWRNTTDAIPIVGPKVFYVEANTQPSHLGLFMRAMASYLGAYYGPNDGVVAVEDQTIPGLGTSLGVLEAGHADLTRRFPSARRAVPRRALIRSIVMAVGRSDAPRRRLKSRPIPRPSTMTSGIGVARVLAQAVGQAGWSGASSTESSNRSRRLRTPMMTAPMPATTSNGPFQIPPCKGLSGFSPRRPPRNQNAPEDRGKHRHRRSI